MGNYFSNSGQVKNSSPSAYSSKDSSSDSDLANSLQNLSNNLQTKNMNHKPPPNKGKGGALAKPLDTQSKLMGIFKTTNIYFLCAMLGFFLVTFQLWAKIMGFFPTLILVVIVLTLSITFIGISNAYPPGFFRHWLKFKTNTQIFIPGFRNPLRI